LEGRLALLASESCSVLAGRPPSLALLPLALLVPLRLRLRLVCLAARVLRLLPIARQSALLLRRVE
jgi:hypothetical protein